MILALYVYEIELGKKLKPLTYFASVVVFTVIIAEPQFPFVLWDWISGRLDSNRRPPAPKAGAIPGYATPRDTDPAS
jgi:hypothetical protein